jgi:hypothetical protein
MKMEKIFVETPGCIDMNREKYYSINQEQE